MRAHFEIRFRTLKSKVELCSLNSLKPLLAYLNLVELRGGQVSLNRYLSGVFCIRNKIKSPKLSLGGELCIQEFSFVHLQSHPHGLIPNLYLFVLNLHSAFECEFIRASTMVVPWLNT